MYVCVLGVRTVSFSENFAHVLNEWSHIREIAILSVDINLRGRLT